MFIRTFKRRKHSGRERGGNAPRKRSDGRERIRSICNTQVSQCLWKASNLYDTSFKKNKVYLVFLEIKYT